MVGNKSGGVCVFSSVDSYTFIGGVNITFPEAVLDLFLFHVPEVHQITIAGTIDVT